MDGGQAGWLGLGVALVAMVGGLVKEAFTFFGKGKDAETAVRLALLDVGLKACEEKHTRAEEKYTETIAALAACKADRDAQAKLIDGNTARIGVLEKSNGNGNGGPK